MFFFSLLLSKSYHILVHATCPLHVVQFKITGRCVCIYMHVYMYLYMYICTYTVCLYVYICIYVYINMYIHVGLPDPFTVQSSGLALTASCDRSTRPFSVHCTNIVCNAT